MRQTNEKKKKRERKGTDELHEDKDERKRETEELKFSVRQGRIKFEATTARTFEEKLLRSSSFGPKIKLDYFENPLHLSFFLFSSPLPPQFFIAYTMAV